MSAPDIYFGVLALLNALALGAAYERGDARWALVMAACVVACVWWVIA